MWGQSRARTALALICGAALHVGLAACSMGLPDVANFSEPASKPDRVAAAPVRIDPRAEKVRAIVTLKPIVGVSEKGREALTRELDAAATLRNFAIVVGSDAPGSHALRGYVITVKEASGNAKASFVWDVADTAGKPINRMAGELPFAPTANGELPAAVVAIIAEKAVATLETAIPK